MSVTVAVDALGGDRAPEEIVAGAVESLRPGLRILMCGPLELVTAELARHGSPGRSDSTAPATISSGARSPPRASTATVTLTASLA